MKILSDKKYDSEKKLTKFGFKVYLVQSDEVTNLLRKYLTE